MSVPAQLVRLAFFTAAACNCPNVNANPLIALTSLYEQTDSSELLQQYGFEGLPFLQVQLLISQPYDQGPPAVAAEPLGLAKIAVPETDQSELSVKWTDLWFRMQADYKTMETCRTDPSSCPDAARLFLEIVELGRQRVGRAQVGEINRAVNLRIKPASDLVQHGVDDFWSTPLATLAAGIGDCEDYAILKYALLHELGVTLDDMRLIVVRDTKRGTNHAVLAVRDKQQWLLLDNRTLVLVKAEDARHYFGVAVLDHRVATTRFEGVAFR